ncbi:MAG TPA: DUF711 family protein [Anaerolineales bacterium]|nr:DUF711 family protein [Anaerolineales bacterium]
MKIRSITYFCNPGYPLDETVLQKAGEFLARAKAAYETAAYEVQTVRLATIPFPEIVGEANIGRLPELTSQLDQLAQEFKIGYVSLGSALPELPRSYEVIPDAIFVSKNVFFSGKMADTRRGVDVSAVRACAEVIVKCASIEPNGFANLQFAALANVDAGAPFFPAAYHDSNSAMFAIAIESADLAVRAFEAAKNLEEARGNLIREIEMHGKRLTDIANSLNCKFGGIDFSLAPFPTESQSLGTAFEKLGIPKIGMHGSLLVAALLTEALDRADFLHTGFNGLMMPILEDATLARRAAEGTLTIKDVLLYSAVCGTGLDTIPLPGDTTAEQIVPLLLDLCALALRLNKPLTARLMPIPGKKAGDETNFDFAFFAPSRVMALDSEGLKGPLSRTETFQLSSRK